MKVRRYKHAKKVLSFYKNTFRIREPYQILVDGTFCHAALKGKIQIKEQLPKYLGGRIQLVTTQCIITELEGLGGELTGAMYVAKRFQLRHCGHHKETQSAAQCVRSMIGEDNPHHYFVATQDPELRGHLRRIAGVPLMHVVSNTIVLENPTRASQKSHDELSAAKVQPTTHEQSVIAALNTAAGSKLSRQQKRKRKRAKGPNPLSVKKSHKMSGGSTSVSSGVVSRSKKRRLRLQRRRAVELLAKVAATYSYSEPAHCTLPDQS